MILLMTLLMSAGMGGTGGLAAQEASGVIPAADPLRVRQDLVDKAMAYRGAPYRYAGTSAAGFDCSGLAYRVYKDVTGKNLPRTARQMAVTGLAVQRRDLTAGDLVFFNTTGSGISHVGIYDGQGGVIHAASAGPQLGVIRSDLDSNYYSRRYVSARRIIVPRQNPGGPSTPLTEGGEAAPAAPGDKPSPGPWQQIAGRWQGDKGLEEVLLRADGTGTAIIANADKTPMKISVSAGEEPGTIVIRQAEPNKTAFYTGILAREMAEQLAGQARPMAWVFRLENRGNLLRGIKETTYFSSFGGKITSVDNSYSRHARWIRKE